MDEARVCERTAVRGKAEHVARFILLKTGLNVVFFAGGCL